MPDRNPTIEDQSVSPSYDFVPPRPLLPPPPFPSVSLTDDTQEAGERETTPNHTKARKPGSL
jgi:hypothetical protein